MSISLSSKFGTLTYSFTNLYSSKTDEINELIHLVWNGNWDNEERGKTEEQFNKRLTKISSDTVDLCFSGSIYKVNESPDKSKSFYKWNIQHLSCYTLNNRSTVIIQEKHSTLLLNIFNNPTTRIEPGSSHISHNPLSVLIEHGRNIYPLRPTVNDIPSRIEKMIEDLLSCPSPPQVTPTNREVNMIQQISYLGSFTLLQSLLKNISIKNPLILSTLSLRLPQIPAPIFSLIINYLPLIPTPEVIMLVNKKASMPLRISITPPDTHYTSTTQLTPLACAIFGEDEQRARKGSKSKIDILDLRSERADVIRLLIDAQADPNDTFEYGKSHIKYEKKESFENESGSITAHTTLREVLDPKKAPLDLSCEFEERYRNFLQLINP